MDKSGKKAEIFTGFDELEPFDPSNPEKELLRAVLVTAINDVKKSGEDRRKATEFFLNPDDDYVFSFVSICEYLRIDPKKVLIVAGFQKKTDIITPDQIESLRKDIFNEDLLD